MLLLKISVIKILQLICSMAMQIKNIFIVLFCFSIFLQKITAQTTGSKSTEITIADNAAHIATITNDAIVLITGSTYSFTVDTHPDSGLILTTATAAQLLKNIKSKYGITQQYRVIAKSGVEKSGKELMSKGDHLIVTSAGGEKRMYRIGLRKLAWNGQLQIAEKRHTVGAMADIVLAYTAGQRSPFATVNLYIPAGITLTAENTMINIIGRGDVLLKDLPQQSIGRVGTKYSYKQVGQYTIAKQKDGTTVLSLSQLDLRPANGADVKITLKNISLNHAAVYRFRASYKTSQPEKLQSAGNDYAVLHVTNFVSDLQRVVNRDIQFKETDETYTTVSLKWNNKKLVEGCRLMQSTDSGRTWQQASAAIDTKRSVAVVSQLHANRFYRFRLMVPSGLHKGLSNEVHYYSGKLDVKHFSAKGDGKSDDTEAINTAIRYLNQTGGGVLLFTKGEYNIRTIQLKSNVWLYISKEAKLQAIKGADAPESTWFSDKQYRSGLSPTDVGPYADPENYLTKQDVGHHYFHNTMFFAEREDNIKIIGNGIITGNGNLVTGDKVMNNTPDNRADKMFTFKLCTNIEIGGVYRGEDLWYDADKDEPYYITPNGTKDSNTSNMLQIDRAGHFVLLATGTDHIYVHNTYFAKHSSSNARDIYDFMGCNNVTVFNIYSRVSSDDIVKPGSDCSLGFTRPARNYKVRNIIGDTNCNLFQIGSETADDIMDVHVDNIYVLAANKAGFSISTNDGAHIKDIHLNCGHTGSIHSRSKMLRSFAPFFISISNRGRILGAKVSRYQFKENGVTRDELLVKNVNIGIVENIIINGIDVSEVYAGSSYGEKSKRWSAFSGTQRRVTPIVAGYALPQDNQVQGGLNFTLPNGEHTGYIRNISFTDVHILVKGGYAISDTAAAPPELGVGQYNASNLKVQPSFGLWAKHVKGLTIEDCSFLYEQPDQRHVLFFEDASGVSIQNVKIPSATLQAPTAVKSKNASVTVGQLIYADQK